MRRVALVFAGGFCGTLARYFLAAPLLTFASLVLPGGRSGFPFDIFFINLSGALALGLLYGLFERGARIAPEMRLAVGTGFLGAYTTFSTFAYGGEKLLTAHATIVGVLYLVGSVALGVASARIGYKFAGPIVMRRRHVRRGLVRARRLGRSIRFGRGVIPGVRAWSRGASDSSDRPGYAREHEEQEVR